MSISAYVSSAMIDGRICADLYHDMDNKYAIALAIVKELGISEKTAMLVVEAIDAYEDYRDET